MFNLRQANVFITQETQFNLMALKECLTKTVDLVFIKD